MATRLSDLAAQAGVSTATVSRVLSGKVGVSAESRQAVLAALDVLGYERPERLRSRSAGLVGLLVPELENPIFPAFVQAIEGGLSRKGFTPLLCTQSPGGTSEDEYVEMLLTRDASGIVFVSGLHADTTASMERYQRLRSRGLPFVLINGFSPDVDATVFSCDDAAGVDLAIGHLISLGHRRIGLATGPQRFVPAKRKLDRFAEALRSRLDIANVDESISLSLFTVEGGQTAAGALLDSGHTAIVCGSDIMALGAIRAARARGLAVPNDVSVIGFDDSKLVAFTDPPLTTVRQPVGAIADAAVNTLVAEIEGVVGSHSEMLFQPELVVRGSTAPAR
ncbi:LacI family DNA-binding transcriptional regulator [Microbacterium sp. STN6]|uniref:LacI family DNA-binding transcriptional regulator n=1 Tax=Microbacterium sp. STN6 TaxID=2995588 RepID=UPI002260C294|nr:LacI family DNA-binding transcriptional regulator [Microbacterium sp. STN6]MCX7520681.1 LacI family DNA-binding transcriptional regulator [Microbacterium sp. STN6]